jgi:tetratricopeptide (TPR) repeat protein
MSRKTRDTRQRKQPEPPIASVSGRLPGFWESHRTEALICAALMVAVLLVFAQVRDFQFINLDDDRNVYENPAVRNGLTLDGLKWAFTATERDYWHPLPWISHMLDAQLFGMHPGGHHLTSVCLHILNAILVFLVLRRMTGAVWRSAMVAALFAIHPLRAESVAWVTERKDVLGGLFWWLTTWAYVEYTKNTASRKRYGLVILLFLMALMSKPTVMTLPFFLLLLDYWPLKRLWGQSRVSLKRSWGQSGVSLVDTPDCPHIILEKLPLFALSGIFVFLTFTAQRQVGATDLVGRLSLPVRVANSLVAYATYLLNAVWPYPLAAIYPYHRNLPAWQVVAAGLLLAAVTALVMWKAVRFPYLPVGWFWYLGALLPVIGLVQMGFQSRADRFTYIPLTGFFLMIVWLAGDLMAKWKHRTVAAVAIAAIVLPALGVRAWSQVGYWHDSITLFQQNLTVTPANQWASRELGTALADAGRIDEAIAAYSQAVALDPTDHMKSRDNLGIALARKGRLEEAVERFQEAQRFWPADGDCRGHRGMALMQMGRADEALACFREAERLGVSPKLASTLQTNLGQLLIQQGKTAEALASFSEAIRLRPGAPDLHSNLAIALMQVGRTTEAISEFKEALRLGLSGGLANWAEANIGWMLLGEGRIPEAVEQYGELVKKEPQSPLWRRSMARALESAGRNEEAIEQLRAVLRLDPNDKEAREMMASLGAK